MKDLYLDFDEKIDIDDFEKRMDIIARMTGTVLEMQEVHPTRRGLHVIVAGEFRRSPESYWITCPTWKDKCECVPLFSCQRQFTPTEICFMQLLLGSDPKRESFNFMRAHNLGDAPAFWHERWNVLYAENNKGATDGKSEKGRIPRDVTDIEGKRSERIEADSRDDFDNARDRSGNERKESAGEIVADAIRGMAGSGLLSEPDEHRTADERAGR